MPLKFGNGATSSNGPIFVASLGAPALTIGLMEFSFSVGLTLGAYAGGRACDDLEGRKAFIVGGIAWADVAFALALGLGVRRLGLATPFASAALTTGVASLLAREGAFRRAPPQH